MVGTVAQLVCPGQTVHFDASASSDADGKLSLYHWDFGDGTTLEGAAVDHAFPEPGTYLVTLTVTDDAGSDCSSVTDTMNVVVDAPPVADAGGDREAPRSERRNDATPALCAARLPVRCTSSPDSVSNGILLASWVPCRASIFATSFCSSRSSSPSFRC